jgi:tRNA (Thr-GGU) A37 N-methylase
MNRSPDIVLKPIGVVRSPIKEVADDGWGGAGIHGSAGCAVVWPGIHASLGPVLALVVIFLLNKFRWRAWKKGARHPRGRTDWPKIGIFAQRSKERPNPIGITVCKLLFVTGL